VLPLKFQGKYPEIDSLISNAKKTFLKAALRVKKFKDGTPSYPLPSQPLLAHWGMWLDAVMYYCEYHSTIRKLSVNKIAMQLNF
jgi:hypothetical protein